jgi:uncharacterized protein YjiS (DUF1127 family)
MSGHVLSRPVATCRPRRQKAGWLAWLAAAVRTIVTRRYLAEMDDRMLKDIGVSRGDALFEANRAPWDVAPRQGRYWEVRQGLE